MARAFPEETTRAILEVFEFVGDNGAWVPELWRIEVANTLNVGIRRGRITTTTRNEVLEDLASLFISIDTECQRHTWLRTLELADIHKLTVYDATYLELALRRTLPLATLDQELRTAVQHEGVLLLGL
jgi:predicted nucleic acid-binding protein